MQLNGAWTRQKPTGLIVGFCAYFEHCFSSATPGGAAFEVTYDFCREAGKSSSWPVTQCLREARAVVTAREFEYCPALPEPALDGGPGDSGRSVRSWTEKVVVPGWGREWRAVRAGPFATCIEACPATGSACDCGPVAPRPDWHLWSFDPETSRSHRGR